MKEKLNIDLHALGLRQLRGLAAVHRTGSVTRAAAELGLTPPAVSMQVRQLEEAVGMPLAQRTPTGFVLTEAGLEVVATTQRIEAAIRDCGEALEVLHRKEGGKVVVGGVSTAKYFLPRAVADFARGAPGVSVRLRIGNRDDIVDALRNFEIDLAVTGRPPQDFPIRRASVGAHPYLVIGPPEHPLAGGGAVPLAALHGETFLMREEGSGTRTLTERLFGEANLIPASTIEMGSNESIKQAVMAGLGIAVISSHTVAVELASKRLVMLPVEGLPVIREWFVTRRREKRLLPAAQAFWDYLAANGHSFLPEVQLEDRGRGSGGV
jgi:LysR family transcriptional regulator, low CO2-responsive transcriptional regulator